MGIEAGRIRTSAIWDLSSCKVRTLAARLLRRGQNRLLTYLYYTSDSRSSCYLNASSPILLNSLGREAMATAIEETWVSALLSIL